VTAALELRRTLPAPPAVVFAAFTEPQELARWWGPQGFAIPAVDFGAEAGETFRIEMQPPEGDPFHVSGELLEFAPPSQLAYTFNWEPPDPDDVENVVRLSFRDTGGATDLALTQGPFKTEARRALHHDGWSDSLDKLERVLTA
jgi:uncharacterized protein YndB with AHSA1/START domain